MQIFLYSAFFFFSSKEGKTACRFYIRQHIPNPLDRRNTTVSKSARRRQGLRHHESSTCFKMASWNIRGVSEKLPMIESFCRTHLIDVIVLQETLRSEGQWPTKLAGYNCIEQFRLPAVASARGILMGIRKGLQVFSVGQSTLHYSFVRVYSQEFTFPFICGTVYLPCKGSPARRSVIRDFRNELSRLKSSYGGCKLLMMGDFNCSADELRIKLLNGDEMQELDIAPIHGSTITWTGPRGRQSSLDHAIVSADCMRQCNTFGIVDSTWDCSDHFPVVLVNRINSNKKVAALVERKPLMKIRKQLDSSKIDSVLNSNIWNDVIIRDDS